MWNEEHRKGHPLLMSTQSYRLRSRSCQILIRGLWSREEGGCELDLASDPSDICAHKADALSDLLPAGEEGQQGARAIGGSNGRCLEHCASLRGVQPLCYARACAICEAGAAGQCQGCAWACRPSLGAPPPRRPLGPRREEGRGRAALHAAPLLAACLRFHPILPLAARLLHRRARQPRAAPGHLVRGRARVQCAALWPAVHAVLQRDSTPSVVSMSP